MTAAMAERTRRILHVEDDDDYVFIFKESIEAEFNAVRMEAARDGFEALRILEASAADPARALPDLVLLDINMPRMNGFDFLRRIKAHPELCGIPVVMLTASKREEDRRMSADLGAEDFICKELDLDRIVDVVRNYLKEGYR